MNPPPEQEPTFEQAMERLEEIVSAMEGERMALDEMVCSYEEGMRLLKVCRMRIDTARRRVEMIVAETEGKASLAPFDPAAAQTSEEVGEEKTKPVSRRRPKAEEGEADEEIRLF